MKQFKNTFLTFDSIQRKLVINAMKFDLPKYKSDKEFRQLISWCERNLSKVS